MASEKQFVDALRTTSERMHSTHYIRHAANERFQYRGPQCMPHRDDIDRLSFEPTSLSATLSSTSSRTATDNSSLPMLQCSHSGCQKWRRVDGPTQAVFSNMNWWKDRRDDEEKQVYEQCHDFDTRLQQWLRLPERLEVITIEEYNDFCACLPSCLGAKLLESVPRGLMHCFTRGCRELSKTVDDNVYEAEGELWNNLDGPVFHCSMVTDTSCEDPCDWQQICEEPYDLQKLNRLAYGEIFIRDVSVNATGNEIIVAKFIEHGSYLDSAIQQ